MPFRVKALGLMPLEKGESENNPVGKGSGWMGLSEQQSGTGARAGSSWCFDPAVGVALRDGCGHSFLKLQDVVLSQLHSAGVEQSCCLAPVQASQAVFLLLHLSLSGLKAKHRGYTCPIPLCSKPGGRVGIGGGSKQDEGKTRREQSLQRQVLFAQYFCKNKGQKMHQEN